MAADPMLAAQASPSKKGTGFRRRCRHSCATTGVMARQMMSLENTADKAPATPMMAPSKALRPSGRVATWRVTAV